MHAASAARRRGAVAAAGHAGDEKTARAALSDDDPGVRAAALAALLRAGRATSADLAAGAVDPSPVVRRRALELCRYLPAERLDIARTALGCLSDDDALVVEAACAALGEIGDAGQADELGSIATSHPDALCREAAVAALGSIGAASSLRVVLNCLSDRPQVRRRAVLALSAFEGKEVEAALLKAADDRDWQVRQAAEDVSGRRPGER